MIENEGRNLYKMLENGQMIDFANIVNQLEIKSSLELNGIETNRLFCGKGCQ